MCARNKKAGTQVMLQCPVSPGKALASALLGAKDEGRLQVSPAPGSVREKHHPTAHRSCCRGEALQRGVRIASPICWSEQLPEPKKQNVLK